MCVAVAYTSMVGISTVVNPISNALADVKITCSCLAFGDKKCRTVSKERIVERIIIASIIVVVVVVVVVVGGDLIIVDRMCFIL